jgi:transposase
MGTVSQKTQEAVLEMKAKGVGLRQISRLLNLSRNTVRRLLRGQSRKNRSAGTPRNEQAISPVRELYPRCRGNVARIKELLEEEHHLAVPYSSLTRMVRELGLREPKAKRVGSYEFGPGEEMQHDTSPHRLTLGGKTLSAQCAALVLAFSRMLFIQYYPHFGRFEAKCFLAEALRFMDGLCSRCIIDNSSVIVAAGSGPSALIAPEMAAFGRTFSFRFHAHRIGDPDRKARVERQFSYAQNNFLAGRSFEDFQDLNRQARLWCEQVANRKPKRSLGMSPQEAYLLEKPHLLPLPPFNPPIYQSFHRLADSEGYVHLDTNRYSVPERLIGKQLELQKYWDRVEIFFHYEKVADHPRVIAKRYGRITDPKHHHPLGTDRAAQGPPAEQRELCGHSEILDRYVAEIKKRGRGRGVIPLRKLLNLKRTYPHKAFLCAVEEALRYGLFDLGRLEQMILNAVANDFFEADHEEP